jgi:hypothetical protein
MCNHAGSDLKSCKLTAAFFCLSNVCRFDAGRACCLSSLAQLHRHQHQQQHLQPRPASARLLHTPTHIVIDGVVVVDTRSARVQLRFGRRYGSSDHPWHHAAFAAAATAGGQDAAAAAVAGPSRLRPSLGPDQLRRGRFAAARGPTPHGRL